MQSEPPFTPNEPSPNHLYIPRLDLEAAVTEGLTTKRFVAITGVSGSGKTWLVKKVLDDNFYEQVPVRIAQGMTLRDSLLNSMQLQYTAKHATDGQKTGLSFEGFLKSSVEQNKSIVFDITKTDIIQIINGYFQKSELDHMAFKFYNIEDAGAGILDEIKDLIKGDDFLENGIKFVFIGATNVQSNFDTLLGDATVIRRGKIQQNIRGLNENEIAKMFASALGTSGIDIKTWSSECWGVTNGVSSYVHEYGNSLHYILQQGKAEKDEVLQKWIEDSGDQIVKKLKENLNTGRGKRRDQIMFVMAQNQSSLFKESELKELIISYDLDEASSAQLNQPLADLVENKILTRISGRYEFLESRMKGILRVCLRKKQDNPGDLCWIDE